MQDTVFAPGAWIWTATRRPNHYALFAKTITLPTPAPLHIRITASSHYELWINGEWLARGPVHGDPQWCQYDTLAYTPRSAGPLHIAVLVHHEDAYVHCLLPAPGGVIAAFEGGDLRFGTDESWRCLTLDMWSQDVSKRGWALGYGEDYDAAREQTGWDAKIFDETGVEWANAVLVPHAETIWANYQPRMTPPLERRMIEPVTFDVWRAASAVCLLIQQPSTRNLPLILRPTHSLLIWVESTSAFITSTSKHPPAKLLKFPGPNCCAMADRGFGAKASLIPHAIAPKPGGNSSPRSVGAAFAICTLSCAASPSRHTR